MWDTLGDFIEVEPGKLAPALLSTWLDPEPATCLMDYLWTTFLRGEEVTGYEDELDSAKDLLRFLALAKVTTGALEIAAGENTLDAWEWVEIPEKTIHPFALGYLLSERGLIPNYDSSFNFNLTALIETFASEVMLRLAAGMNSSEYFTTIWSAQMGVVHFPPRVEDMAGHGFHLDELSIDQGLLMDYVDEAWPHRAQASTSDPGELLF